MVLLLRLTVIFFAAIHRALGAPLITSSIPHTAQVLLPYGQLIGNRLELVDEYLGVPYAKPPTRFEPAEAWSSPYPNGTWKASEYSDICLQVVRDPNDILHPTGSVHGSEDCLHLNIYTPRHGRKPLPVMLWIHGGDLTQGSAMNPLFNGSHLAASQRVVVVAINYRLNALGFLAIQRDDGTTSSNNGLRDQQEAMRFVKRNIAAFGGQPNNVTIFGESAGGLSVGVHLVSPSSANLFAAAIFESGDITNNAPLSLALNDTATLVERFSCARNAFSCLKTVNVSQLVAAFMTLPHARGSVVIDGDVLPAAVVEMVELKQFNKVPYILGNNADEASLFMNITSYTAAGASCVIQKGFGAVKALEILSLYPLVEGTDNRQALVDLMSDIMYHCENRRFALALAEAGHAGHMYSFKRHSGAAGCRLPGAVPGAAHAAEVGYVFGTLDVLYRAANCAVPAGDLQMASQISQLWGSFARSHHAAASWPVYSHEKEEIAKLQLGMSAGSLDTETGYRRGQCLRLEEMGLRFKEGVDMLYALNICDPQMK